MIRRRVDDVLDILVPTKESERTRESIVTWVRERIVEDACPGSEIRVGGSYALKTYLPDADVDLIVMTKDVSSRSSGSSDKNRRETSNEDNGEDTLVRLCGRACSAARRRIRRAHPPPPFRPHDPHADRHEVRNVFFVNGEIPVLRIAIDNVHVDVVSETRMSLDAFDYFERLDARVGSDHLFKRSLLLVKAWCRYEKDAVGGAREGGLATHAINAMVAEIFRDFGAYVKHPLDVFAHFVERYGESGTTTASGSSLPRCARVVDPLDASRNCARALSSSKASAFALSLARIRNDVRSVVTFEPCSGGGDASGGSGRNRKKKSRKKRVLDVTQKLRLLDETIFPGTWAALTRRRRQRGSGGGGAEEGGKGDGALGGHLVVSVPWRPDLLKHPLQRVVPEERRRTRRSPLKALVGSSMMVDGGGLGTRRRKRAARIGGGVGRTLLGVATFVAVVAAGIAAMMMTKTLSPPQSTLTTIDVTASPPSFTSSAPPRTPPPPPATTTVWIPHAVAVGLETSGKTMRLVQGNFRVVAGPGVTVRNLPPPPSRHRENGDRRDESSVKFVRTALGERAILRASDDEGRRADDALTTYRWFRNGLPLFDDDDEGHNKERRELVVESVTPRDLGTYSCRVSNPLWGGGEDAVREWVVMVA